MDFFTALMVSVKENTLPWGVIITAMVWGFYRIAELFGNTDAKLLGQRDMERSERKVWQNKYLALLHSQAELEYGFCREIENLKEQLKERDEEYLELMKRFDERKKTISILERQLEDFKGVKADV